MDLTLCVCLITTTNPVTSILYEKSILPLLTCRGFTSQSEFLLFIYEIFCCFLFLDLHSPLLFCWGLFFKEGVCQVGCRESSMGGSCHFSGAPLSLESALTGSRRWNCSIMSSRLCVDFIKDFPKYLSATFHLPQGSYARRDNTSIPIV